MIGAVAGEVASGVGVWAQSRALLSGKACAEVGLVGDRETQQVAVEVNARFDVVDVDAEVPQPPDAEGSI